jgi:hypothetical protein
MLRATLQQWSLGTTLTARHGEGEAWEGFVAGLRGNMGRACRRGVKASVGMIRPPFGNESHNNPRPGQTFPAAASVAGRCNGGKRRGIVAACDPKIPIARSAFRKWSAAVARKSDALDLKPGIFKARSARRIALSLKRSADAGHRRKASPFQSAMSKLNFEINRGGRGLS